MKTYVGEKKATYYLVTDEGEIREINITFEKYHKMLHDKKQNVFYYESDAEAYAKKCYLNYKAHSLI